MNNIYFDNAATSFPKPKEVLDAIMEQMINFGGSANRGSSKPYFKAVESFTSVEKLSRNFLTMIKVRM